MAVYRLPGHQRQPLVDTDLRHPWVLDGVRPAPEHLSIAKAGYIAQGGLGQQHHVAGRNDLLTRTDARDLGGEMLVREAEVLALSPLKDDSRPKVGLNPVEVLRMDRQPELVLLARAGKDAKTELIHEPRASCRLKRPPPARPSPRVAAIPAECPAA